MKKEVDWAGLEKKAGIAGFSNYGLIRTGI
jgi:hypothetical protein